MLFELANLSRLLHNLIRPGTIAEVDIVAARVRVQSADLLTGWLPWLTARAGSDRTWWAPTVGEQVLLISPSGDPAQGYVLTGVYQADFPPNADDADVHRTTYGDGAAVEYDTATQRMNITLPAGGTVAITADGGLDIIGDITVTGDVLADGISLKHHTHGGVMAGGVQTEEPT